MNTKFSVTLLFVLIVLIVTACAPAIADGVAPVAIAIPPAENVAAVVPVTGEQAAEAVHTAEQAPRLWSGEVFSSGNDTPDSEYNTTLNTGQDEQNACFSADSQPRRYGGCME